MRQTSLIIKIFYILLVGLLIEGCSQNDGAVLPEHEDRLSIIFDTDMGSDCDDVGALALLHTYADMDKVKIVGTVYSSGKVPYGAGVIEAINVYYGRPAIPVGAYYGDDIGDPVDKMLSEKLAKNTAQFGHTIVHNHDAEEITRLNRRLLVGEKDNNVVYITVGHTKGLYDLLTSPADDISPLTGKELIEQKISRWVALGALRATTTHRKDWNFFSNGTAPYTDYLITHFPRPIAYITAGTDVLTGKSLAQTPEGNIVRTAYEQWLWNYSKTKLADQRPSWDLAAVYYAVEGLGTYLTEGKNGVLEFNSEEGCRWVPGEKSNQILVAQKPGASQAFADYLNTLIAQGK